jgi:hypothetical protein
LFCRKTGPASQLNNCFSPNPKLVGKPLVIGRKPCHWLAGGFRPYHSGFGLAMTGNQLGYFKAFHDFSI